MNLLSLHDSYTSTQDMDLVATLKTLQMGICASPLRVTTLKYLKAGGV